MTPAADTLAWLADVALFALGCLVVAAALRGVRR